MYTGLLHTHRLFAYLFLVAAVAAVAMAKHGWLLKRTQQNAWDRRTALFALIFGHLQLLFGLALYFVGPWFNQLTTNTAEVMKNADLRWFAVEHIAVNIIGIALITVGYSKSKKQPDAAAFFTRTWWMGIGLLLILSRIPWERLF
ncbi:MAG: hypothetical protein NWS18_00875 [Schleiferiaceae bacterium]|jgi:hypothetical protein|nr:hypothetical protein [Schleiferiaceae bacterium]MDP4626799.1 hypothetical protein [Schleiferiaceae bacterium]MDP4749199.1 hypothetical protein [Schleiferiaceae bacterium]MDP4859144.1 hypothetical protein [Schleiferiaceae bacterium]MDP4900756.1 hypothetical protein [Schleiferiaceae bacterium]